MTAKSQVFASYWKLASTLAGLEIHGGSFLFLSAGGGLLRGSGGLFTGGLLHGEKHSGAHGGCAEGHENERFFHGINLQYIDNGIIQQFPAMDNSLFQADRGAFDLFFCCFIGIISYPF